MKPQIQVRPAWPGRKRLLLILTCLIRIVCSPAQTEDVFTGEILEGMVSSGSAVAESDAAGLPEYLEALQSRPLNINTVQADDLLTTGLLTRLQVEQLLQYRNQLGPLVNLYELQAVPGWELSDINRLLPYIQVGDGGLEQSALPWYTGLTQGRNELLLRWSRPDLSKLPASMEGGPDALAFRFRHNFNNRVRFGLTAERDPGEAFFKGSNPYGFDFYSGHFFLQGSGKAKHTLALGDYTARFGQGLLLQTGFVPGKSAETIGSVRGGRKISPYHSFGEAFFLRGMAATAVIGTHWDCTVLYSRRRRDVNLLAGTVEEPQDAFSAVQTSGLHRTPSEREDERAVSEQLAGVSVERQYGPWRFALNGFYLHYDKTWQPSLSPSRRYAFSGKEQWGLSADYARTYRNLLLYGEIARSGNGAPAFVTGLMAGLDRNVTLALTHRLYTREYQAAFAAPFSEAGGAANEHGLYMGLEVRPSRTWRFSAYADVWRHPWLRSGALHASGGWEHLIRAMWMPQKGFSLYTLWQTKRKGTGNGLPDETGLSRFRVHAVYKMNKSVELRQRIEWTFAGTTATSRGFAAFLETVFKAPGAPLAGTFRYTLFDTDDFDTRVYAYERDLFSALSIPAFSGRGSRFYLNLSWRTSRWLRLEARLEQTRLRRAVTDGSTPGVSTVVKVQARLQFQNAQKK